MDTKEIFSYNTWYEFKKELQRRSGIPILNRLWIQIKPKSPLPWHEFQMKAALSELSTRILKLKTCPRCGSKLILDRDEDGYYKRCIQCSFGAEIIPPKLTTSTFSFRGRTAPSTEERLTLLSPAR